METDTKSIVAVGNDARNMIGRTPGNVVALRPMKDGVIADYETTATMMKYYINQALKGKGLLLVNLTSWYVYHLVLQL